MPSISEVSDAHESAAQLIPWLVNGTLAEPDAARLRAHLAECTLCREELEAERRLHELIRNDGPLVFPGESAFQRLMARIEADEFAAPRSAAPADATRATGGERPPADEVRPAGEVRPAAAKRGRSALRRRSARRPRLRSPTAVRWLTAVVVLEALGLGLGAWMWRAGPTDNARGHGSVPAVAQLNDSPAPAYRTLTSAPARYGTGLRVRVIFRANLSLGQLRKLLQSVGAHIVDGPTEARVYTLGFAEPIESTREVDARITMLRANPSVLFAEPAGDPP